MRRGILSGALAAAAALLLTACAGLPVAGGVEEGLPVGEAAGSPDFSFIPDRPQPGASPAQIVEGFIRAGSGTADDWARAREFLAPELAEVWEPDAGVTVVTGERTFASTIDEQVTVGVTATATVDELGGYTWADSAPATLPFELAKMEDGEWRITAARDGVVLDANVFPRVYHRYELAYFDPDYAYLVPDVRWFPTTKAPTRIVDALVNKPPAGWLEASIVTAFPEGVVANSAVPVSAGVASVSLSESAAELDQETLDRMQTQLEASLSTAGIAAAEMTTGAGALAAEPVTTRRTTVSGPPLVVIEEGFGYLSGDEITRIPGLSEAMDDVDAAAVQVSPDQGTAAVLASDGRVLRVEADTTIYPADSRSGLVAPSVDDHGAVWSVPRDAPQGLIVEDASGAVAAVADAWPGATQVHAFSVSREGTRIAALVTTGGDVEVWVAGIIRDADGVRLSAPVPLGEATGTGLGLAWLDDVTVGVLMRGTDETEVREYLVGGSVSTTDAPADIVSLAGAGSTASVRLRGADGTLYVKRGTNWQVTASGVLVLAQQQGMPR